MLTFTGARLVGRFCMALAYIEGAWPSDIRARQHAGERGNGCRQCPPTHNSYPLCDEGAPRRLWSLWEMLELKAAPFYLAVAELAEISAWIAAGKSQVRGSISEAENLLPPDKAFLVPKLATLRFQLATLGAPVTALALEEAQQAISGAFQPPMTWGAARTRIEDVRTTLRRELSRLTLLVLEPREQEFYAPAQPLFGPDVAAKFPTQAAFEIDEAAKCLALDRSTGAVFHLMRVMEVGIRAVARSWRDGDSQVR